MRRLSLTRFWVYENWRANGHRATVHRADCGHCNDGIGQQRGTNPSNGQWLGPHSTAEDAVTAASATGAEVRRCSACNP